MRTAEPGTSSSLSYLPICCADTRFSILAARSRKERPAAARASLSRLPIIFFFLSHLVYNYSCFIVICKLESGWGEIFSSANLLKSLTMGGCARLPLPPEVALNRNGAKVKHLSATAHEPLLAAA